MIQQVRSKYDDMIISMARKALRKKVHGYTPDSTIPVICQIGVQAKHWIKKNGVFQAFWENLPVTECMLDDILVSAGRDLIHNASFMNGAQPAQAAYYALTSTNITPAAGDTTMSGELATPTHMVRHLLTQNWGGVTESYTHTASGNTSAMVASWENNTGSGSITVYAYGSFNAASVGTMLFESTFSNVTLNSAAGAYDVIKLTVTITLG